MEPDAGAPEDVRLPFETGDRFMQVHADGAILVVADDYQWNLASIGQAVAVALEAVGNGTRILVDHGILDDRTTAVLESVRRTGASVVDFGTVIPPMTWPHGTTPLMTAAAQARNDLIEDLLARGFPADATDDSGATALHHAAHSGNEAGAVLLLAAGLDPSATDHEGRTPGQLARAAGHVELAALLEPDAPGGGTRPRSTTSTSDDYGWRGPAKLAVMGWASSVSSCSSPGPRSPGPMCGRCRCSPSSRSSRGPRATSCAPAAPAACGRGRSSCAPSPASGDSRSTRLRVSSSSLPRASTALQACWCCARTTSAGPPRRTDYEHSGPGT